MSFIQFNAYMKRYERVIVTLALIAVTTLSCAQKPYQKEVIASSVPGPELRWKYETGG
jgi:hypothetical protein